MGTSWITPNESYIAGNGFGFADINAVNNNLDYIWNTGLNPSTDNSWIIGRCKLTGISDFAIFSHEDYGSIASGAFLQLFDGATIVNTHTGKTVDIRENNITLMSLGSSKIYTTTKMGINTINPLSDFVISDSGNNGLEINANVTVGSATGAYIASFNRVTGLYEDLIFDFGGVGFYSKFEKATGNLILGATASSGSFKLEVNGDTKLSGLALINDNTLPSLAWNTIGAQYRAEVSVGNGAWFLSDYTGVATARIGVFPSGNVGIGYTTDPTVRLGVNGTFLVTGVSTFNSNINPTTTPTSGTWTEVDTTIPRGIYNISLELVSGYVSIHENGSFPGEQIWRYGTGVNASPGDMIGGMIASDGGLRLATNGTFRIRYYKY